MHKLFETDEMIGKSVNTFSGLALDVVGTLLACAREKSLDIISLKMVLPKYNFAKDG